MTSATPSSPAPHRRTFDCPWCGAINPVPGDHLGEHFTCSECKKSTKLTEKNTSTKGATTSPDATAHLSGDRTFDCPWCGAIAAVPSSHLGERFACPECKKETRLTAANTRRAPITAPPPEAPPFGDSTGGSKTGLIAIIGVAVVGGLVWAFLPKGSYEGPGAPSRGSTSEVVNVPTEPPSAAMTPDAAMDAAMGTAAPPPVVTPPPATAPSANPLTQPTPKAMDADLLKGLIAKATTDLANAVKARADAQEKFDAWTKDNPDIVEMEKKHAALREITGEAKRLTTATPALLDPVKATPDAARTFDAAMSKYVGASTARTSVAEQAIGRMHSELVGRYAGHDWKSIVFHGAAFSRALAALDEGYGGMAGLRPPELSKAVTDADAAIAAAKQAKADAEARLAALK